MRKGMIFSDFFNWKVVSVCFLIYCIVNVISPPKEAHGSLLESSSLYQILPKRIRDKLSVLSTQEKDEVYKSLPNAVIELQEATSGKQLIYFHQVTETSIVNCAFSNTNSEYGVQFIDDDLQFRTKWK